MPFIQQMPLAPHVIVCKAQLDVLSASVKVWPGQQGDCRQLPSTWRLTKLKAPQLERRGMGVDSTLLLPGNVFFFSGAGELLGGNCLVLNLCVSDLEWPLNH